MTSWRARRRYSVGHLRAAGVRRRRPKVAIVGGGFGGLAAAVALRRAGIDDLVIIEGDDGVGGTWRRNIYPGAACDVQSHLYSFSFALNKSWSRTYARQPEILAYLESVADDFDLRKHLILQTYVRRAQWNEDTWQWELQLQEANSGVVTTLRADIVVSAVGLFADARMPDVDGLTSYRGHLMHTAAWDPGVDLAGREVAVIGSGASAVQVVPELARIASRVTVFQRTPPWMVPKDDRPFSDDELTRFHRWPWAARRERWRVWKQFHDFAGSAVDDPQVASRAEIATHFLQSTVADERLRHSLTPHYPFRCKRVLLGADYYLALQKEHVDLVTEPIARVTETSIVTVGGEVLDVDAIVCATGFQTSKYLNGIEVIGRDGESLHERWGDDPSAYLGVAVSGFPNFFMLYGPNTNQGGNSIVYILEAGARLVASAASRVARRGGYLDVRPEVERRYNEELSAALERTIWTGCDSYFRSSTGRIVTQWPYTELEYARRTWRLRPREWVHCTEKVPAGGPRSAEPEINDAANQLPGGQVGVGVVDLVEPVALGDHLVEE